MTEDSCWQAIDGLLKGLRDDLMNRMARLREAPFRIKSLEETRNLSLAEFLDAALALPARSHEDRLFLVEEILCGRLADLSGRTGGESASLAAYAKELHGNQGYRVYSRASLEAMQKGTLFKRFGFSGQPPSVRSSGSSR